MSRDEMDTLWLERQVVRLKAELRSVEHQRNLLGIYLFLMALVVLILSPNPFTSLGGFALLALSAYVEMKWK